MAKNFLELNDLYNTEEENNNIFDDVEIIIDPELEDESTVDINNYLNKFILQCRICGNMFPSEELLDNETECPICDSKSSDGFIFKGKLLKKNVEKEMSPEEKTAIDNLMDATEDSGRIPIEGEFDKYRKNDLSDNYDDIE
jgi:predicted Zn-ribbon and HTH transcriptional regulator